jgi:type II secretory pathway pseudopilin PulG
MQRLCSHNFDEARNRRSGLSLLEVIAGIALLSTLLVSCMLAWSLHRRQIRVAELQIEAAELADQQLTLWYADKGRLPEQPAGSLMDHKTLKWTLEPVDEADDLPKGFQLKRLVVRDEQNHGLLHVDLLTPDSEP